MIEPQNSNRLRASRLKKFPQFHKLAPELRLKIYSYIMPEPYIIPLNVIYTGGINFCISFDDGNEEEEEEKQLEKRQEETNRKNRNFLPLITKVHVLGISHTCRELREFYLKTYPDRLELSDGKGIIHLHYPTTIIYLRRFDKLVSQPAISHCLFDRINSSNTTNDNNDIKLWHHSYFLPFPSCFNQITQLALSIDCIVEYPELSPHPFTLRSQLTESAFFAKMLQPFPSLTHLWAVANDVYWQLDIHLTLQGYFQPYPGYTNVSVLGCLAERKEQLALWAGYRNAMHRMKCANAELSITNSTNLPPTEKPYIAPALMIWGMEEVDLWNFLHEVE